MVNIEERALKPVSKNWKRAYIFLWVIAGLALLSQAVSISIPLERLPGTGALRASIWLEFALRAIVIPWLILAIWKSMFHASRYAKTSTEIWIRRILYVIWIIAYLVLVVVLNMIFNQLGAEEILKYYRSVWLVVAVQIGFMLVTLALPWFVLSKLLPSNAPKGTA